MRKDHQKVRLSVDCTEEERMYIKMLAARENKTISDYLLSYARENMPKCTRSHEPNEKTKRALESDEVTTYENIDDFWKAMGMSKDVNP